MIAAVTLRLLAANALVMAVSWFSARTPWPE